MKPITLILPYYNNPGMLKVQQETWAAYPEELKPFLHVVVVDDGSPSGPASAAMMDRHLWHGLGSVRLYRAGVDIRWNWLFCRNLGAAEAKTDWLLLTDIDHVLPTNTLRQLIVCHHDPKKVYRFSRVSMPDLSTYHPHADSFFMTRELFWKIGGYDERFSGYYGSSSDIRHRMKAMGTPIELLKEFLIRYPREVVADASTPKFNGDGTLTRKTPEDDAGLRRIRDEISRLPVAQRKPLTLRIPYDRLI